MRCCAHTGGLFEDENAHQSTIPRPIPTTTYTNPIPVQPNQAAIAAQPLAAAPPAIAANPPVAQFPPPPTLTARRWRVPVVITAAAALVALVSLAWPRLSPTDPLTRPRTTPDSNTEAYGPAAFGPPPTLRLGTLAPYRHELGIPIPRYANRSACEARSKHVDGDTLACARDVEDNQRTTYQILGLTLLTTGSAFGKPAQWLEEASFRHLASNTRAFGSLRACLTDTPRDRRCEPAKLIISAAGKDMVFDGYIAPPIVPPQPARPEQPTPPQTPKKTEEIKRPLAKAGPLTSGPSTSHREPASPPKQKLTSVDTAQPSDPVPPPRRYVPGPGMVTAPPPANPPPLSPKLETLQWDLRDLTISTPATETPVEVCPPDATHYAYAPLDQPRTRTLIACIRDRVTNTIRPIDPVTDKHLLSRATIFHTPSKRLATLTKEHCRFLIADPDACKPLSVKLSTVPWEVPSTVYWVNP